MKNSFVITIIVAIVIGVGGFFAGMKYQESKQSTLTQQFGSGLQRGTRTGSQVLGQGRGRMGTGQTVGEILNQDDTSVTVKLQDGSTKIVLLSDKTTFNKATQGSKNDLQVGERVVVFGTTNSDGSVTAQNIQLNPTLRNITGGTPR